MVWVARSMVYLLFGYLAPLGQEHVLQFCAPDVEGRNEVKLRRPWRRVEAFAGASSARGCSAVAVCRSMFVT